MKVIVSTNQKGGVGKTAIIVHLCFYLSKLKNKRVLLFDLDPQGNATKTLSLGSAGQKSYDFFIEHLKVKPSTESWTVIEADPRLYNTGQLAKQKAFPIFKKNIKDAGSYFDYVLIDTPPTQEFTMLGALYVANYAFCPIIPEGYSIDGIVKMLQIMQGMTKGQNALNKDLYFLGMVPSKIRGTSTNHKAAIAELYAKYPQFMLCTEDGGLVGVTERQAVAEALDSKAAVWEISKKSNDGAALAGKDFFRVFDSMLNQMGDTTDA